MGLFKKNSRRGTILEIRGFWCSANQRTKVVWKDHNSRKTSKECG